jgi:prevent-host-death family protein
MTRITATELARRLGDVLARVRYREESFVVERGGKPVARLVPLGSQAAPTARQALATWRRAGRAERAFADDLEAVARADQAPGNPWAS